MKKEWGRGSFWKRIVCVLAILALSLSIASCRKSGGDAFSFREVAFCAEVSWEKEDERFCARIHNKPSQKLQISSLDVAVVGEEEQRYAEYVLPSALEGVKVEIGKDGKCKISLGGAHVSTENAKELSLVLDAIFGQGSAAFVGEGVIDGVDYDQYRVSCEIGNADYFIDRQTKFPKRIVLGDVNFDFVWVETTS